MAGLASVWDSCAGRLSDISNFRNAYVFETGTLGTFCTIRTSKVPKAFDGMRLSAYVSSLGVMEQRMIVALRRWFLVELNNPEYLWVGP